MYTRHLINTLLMLGLAAAGFALPGISLASAGSENTNEQCSDGIDNDADGYVDCADYDCSKNPAVNACGGGKRPVWGREGWSPPPAPYEARPEGRPFEAEGRAPRPSPETLPLTIPYPRPEQRGEPGPRPGPEAIPITIPHPRPVPEQEMLQQRGEPGPRPGPETLPLPLPYPRPEQRGEVAPR